MTRRMSLLQGLRAWGWDALGAALPAAALNGSNVKSAFLDAVAMLAAIVEPACIVFVEDDWQVSDCVRALPATEVFDSKTSQKYVYMYDA